MSSEAKKTPGPAKKSKEDKESFPLSLKFTPAEGAALKKNAGHERLATFVKRYLREQTDLLK